MIPMVAKLVTYGTSWGMACNRAEARSWSSTNLISGTGMLSTKSVIAKANTPSLNDSTRALFIPAGGLPILFAISRSNPTSETTSFRYFRRPLATWRSCHIGDGQEQQQNQRHECHRAIFCKVVRNERRDPREGESRVGPLLEF